MNLTGHIAVQLIDRRFDLDAEVWMTLTTTDSLSPLTGANPGCRWLDRADWVLLSLLALVTFCLYFRTHGFSFVNYDDTTYLMQDWHVRGGLSWANLRWAMTSEQGGNWYPLNLLVDMTLTSLFGQSAAAFHILNALLHSANVVLLFVFLRRTTGLRAPAFIVAALWGWHPLRVESVAWASELKDVLCGTFWFLCLLAYVNYRRKPRVGKYLAVAGFLALALMVKSMAVTLPAVLLLLDYWPLGRGADQGNLDANKPPIQWWLIRILEKIPLMLLSLGACVMAMHTQRIGGAMASTHIFTWHLRWTNALISFVTYIGKTLWPSHLGLIYSHPAMIGTKIPTYQWIGAAIVLWLVTAIVFWQRRSRPYLVTGWLWFVGTLVPVVGLVQVGEQAHANRYTYLPSIGLLVAIVWLAWSLVASRRLGRKLAAATAGAICLALAVATFIQVGYWRDTDALFRHSNAVIPNNYLARAILSVETRLAGQNDQAISLARSAVAICPRSELTHTALAQSLAVAGQSKESLNEYITAIKLNPSKAGIRNDVGVLLVTLNRNADAMVQFREAIRFDPYLADARHNLAVLLAAQGKYDQAIAQWREAIHLEPANGIYHGWLGEALWWHGDRRAAVEQYRTALAAGEHHPDWETSLAWFVATDPQTTPDEAQKVVATARDACDRTGNKDPLALNALAAALARAGRFDEAVTTAQLAATRAGTAGQADLARAIQARLADYQSGRPFITRSP
jgi:tetratricopeptide (TPR) repeat protein